MTTPLERVRDALLTAGSHRSGSSGWTCPAHDDRSASLSVSQGRDGRVLLKCHTGCGVDDILTAINLTKADLFPPKDPSSNGSTHGSARPTLIKAYDYLDENGDLLFQALRYFPKDFRQRRRPRPTDPPDSIKRGWVYNLTDTRRVLYRLPQILAAVTAGQEIWVCEGEKDVHALERAGAVATCNPMGAGKWHSDYAKPLAGARVTVVADHDDPGRAHALTVARSLRVAGCHVRIVRAATGKDADDHLTAGLTLADFLDLEETQDGPPSGQPTAEPDQPDEADGPTPRAVEIHDFLNAADPDYDWLIPGLLERGDRVILTGPEGGGKSTLLRQLLIQAGAGIHPFTLEPIDPVRVLYVDLENAQAHVRRQLKPFVASVGDKLGRDLVYVTVQPAGIDLLHQGNVEWLAERVNEAAPQLVIIGPLYKMASGDPTSEEVARKVSAALDQLRTDHAFALILEAHSPHAPAGGRRPVRPYGASMWLRWPEFGIYLADTGALKHWRGPRDEREWPTALKRGGAWKWTMVTDPREELFHQIVTHCEQTGFVPSDRALADMLNVSRAAIQRALKVNPAVWEQIKATLKEDQP